MNVAPFFRPAALLMAAYSMVIPLRAQAPAEDAPLPAPAGAAAPEDEALPARTVSLLGGVDFIPKLKWSAQPITNHKHMSYAFEDSSLISLTGSIVNTKLGLSLGIDASVDNNKVNKAYKLGTSLGFKQFMLRVQTGSLEGKATWDATLVAGQSAEMAFKNKYTNVDILYFLKDKAKNTSPMYIGLGYTSFQIPMQIDTLVTDSDKAHQSNGVSTYDKDYKIKGYSFLFGMDFMIGSMLSPTANSGIGAMLSTQDRVGIGTTDISEEARQNASILNPGRTPNSPHMTAGLVDYDISLGIRYTYVRSRLRASIGLGYNYGATMIMNFSGAASNPTELGYEGDFTLQRHGPILRGYIFF